MCVRVYIRIPKCVHACICRHWPKFDLVCAAHLVTVCRHSTSSDDDVLAVRDLLLSWLRAPFIEGPADKPFIRNKMAQLIALVFVQDYPRRVRAKEGEGRGREEQLRGKRLRGIVI